MGHPRLAVDYRSRQGSRSRTKGGVRPVRGLASPGGSSPHLWRPFRRQRHPYRTVAAARHRIAAPVRCRRRRYSLILSITSSWRNSRA